MNVFEKTRELGDAILQSAEYKDMKEAEQLALQNDLAARHITSYVEHKQTLAELMEMDMPDQDEISRHVNIMEDIQQQLSMIDEVNDMTNKRQAFADLIEQVNDVLRFIITGEMDGTAHCESCEECGGCGSRRSNAQ